MKASIEPGDPDHGPPWEPDAMVGKIEDGEAVVIVYRYRGTLVVEIDNEPARVYYDNADGQS